MPDPSAPKHAEMTDFPDRLSPMLVKELRQGMRTNLFVTAFILLQGFMILCILMGSNEPDARATNWFFWFFIFISFIIVQPLRGFAALSAEYHLNTMDLIQMTRLNAWRITFGKWCAINAQTLLLLTAVLPYLVLRYFFGSVNVFADLGCLVLLALASGMISAITVGCSAFKGLIVRLLLLVGFGVGCTIGFVYAIDQLLDSPIRSSDMIEIALFAFFMIFMTFFMLLLGASRIAPGSENYSFAKRIGGLGFAVGAWCFQLIGTNEEPANVLASFILGFTLIDAITEKPPVYEAVLKPFNRSVFHRFFSLFLTPGWHTGILFFFIPCFLIWAPAMMLHFGGSPDWDELSIIINGAGMILFPIIIIHVFFRRASHDFFSLYMFIQAALVLVTILTVVVSDSGGVHEELVCLVFPLPCNLFFCELTNSLDEAVFVIIGLAWLLLGFFIPMILGPREFKNMREGYQQINATATES